MVDTIMYEPAEDSFLLAKAVSKYAKGKCLDVGTGSGIQALTAAKKRVVRSVLAVDLDPEVVKLVNGKDKKVKVKKSDLFSNVKGKFDTIIFNPPYLPQDKGIEDIALYGGKHGYELTVKFISKMGSYMEIDGQVLLLFSSLTRKSKVDEALKKEMFEFSEIKKQHVFMEDLFVYRIIKSRQRQELEKVGVSELSYFDKGKRGLIFTGKYKRKDVAVKVKNPTSEATNMVANEARWLKRLEKLKIGPKLLLAGKHHLIYEFVEGEFIGDYLDNASTKSIRVVIKKLIDQCYQFDNLGVNKEEMHRPVKHILVKGASPRMIDFERMHHSKKIHNITQFCTFLMSRGVQAKLNKKKIILPESTLKDLAKQYHNQPKEVYDQLKKLME